MSRDYLLQDPKTPRFRDGGKPYYDLEIMWEVVLGAFLAVVGGMLGELWRELRANRADVRILHAEIEGLRVMCDIYLRQGSEVSISHYLTQLQSFAIQGSAGRVWVRAITDPAERETIFVLYAMAAALVHNLEQLVARETAAREANNREAFARAVKENRELAIEGFRMLRQRTDEAAKMLGTVQERPLLQ
jgi:hypothetical protein